MTTAINSVVALNGTVQTLSASIANNVATTTVLSAQVATQVAQTTALDARIDTQAGMLGALAAADFAITSQVAVQAGTLTTLDGRLTVQEAAGVALGTRVAATEGSLAGVQASLTSHDSQLATLGTRLGATDAALTAQVGDLAAVDVRVTANTAAIGTVGNRVGVLEGNARATTAAVMTLGGRIDTVAADVSTLGGRVGVAETAIAANVQAVAALDVRVTDNSSAISRERTRNDTQDGQLAAQSTRIDAVGAVANTALAGTQALRSDVTAGRVGIVQVAADEAITVGASLGGTTVLMAGTGGTRRISGVSAGSQADDVATVGQMTGAMASTLGAANLYTDRSILRALDQQMGTTRTMIAENNGVLRREINGAAANGAALAGLPQSVIPGKGFAGVSMGGKGGEVAIALGASKAFDGDHAPVLRAGAAIDTRRGDLTYNAGVGFHF